MKGKALIQFPQPRIAKVFSDEFGGTSNPLRVWVPQEIIDSVPEMEIRWEKAVGKPDGVPLEVSSAIGWDRPMTEDEFQDTLKRLGVREIWHIKYIAFQEPTGEIYGYVKGAESWDDLDWDVQFSSLQEAEDFGNQ